MVIWEIFKENIHENKISTENKNSQSHTGKTLTKSILLRIIIDSNAEDILNTI